MTQTSRWIFPLVLVLGLSAGRAAAPAISIDAASPAGKVSPTFYGLMTEEINHSYDGGLYAELIQNRTFQDNSKDPVHWSAIGGAKMSMVSADPVNSALPISLQMDLTGGDDGIANDGYWGIPVRPDTTYKASFYAKSGAGFNGPLTAAIVLDDGNAVVAKADTSPITGDWTKYSLTLRTANDA